MAEYDFQVTICGTVVAYSEEEARLMINIEPSKWGTVDIDYLEIIGDSEDWEED